MNHRLAPLFALLLLSPSLSHAFGAKKMQISELRGVTESQVAAAGNQASVMVRGKAAELIFRMMKQRHEEQPGSDALKWVGAKDASHWTVKGKQLACSKISNPRTKQDDYACAFQVDQRGTLALAGEAFDPAVFNLARTETGSKLFRKKTKGARGLASVATNVPYSKGQAYLVYDAPGKQRQSENAMIVFRGEAAKEILSVLANPEAGNREAQWGEAIGYKGKELACVSATEKEPERCALVVSFKDGSATKAGNPLFR